MNRGDILTHGIALLAMLSEAKDQGAKPMIVSKYGETHEIDGLFLNMQKKENKDIKNNNINVHKRRLEEI